MTTIDHRAAMISALTDAKNVDSELMSARFLATAQVHATALLAEQQLVANQIAFVQNPRAMLDATFKYHGISEAAEKKVDLQIVVIEEIRKALGLS